jgi:hypothetical protein
MTEYPSRQKPGDQLQQVVFPDQELHAHSYDLNDMSGLMGRRIQNIGDVFLQDGALTSGGAVIHNAESGQVTVEGGNVYIRGMVHKIPEASFVVPTTGVVSIGVYLTNEYITHLQDPQLTGQIVSTRTFAEPGAHRLKITGVWGFDGDANEGDFFPVTEINNGVLVTQTPPPQIDPLLSGLARYDREANGNYIVNGFKVISLGKEGDDQVFSISEGTVNVWGTKIIRDTGQRIKINEDPHLEQIEAEPHVIAGDASGDVTILLNHGPVVNIDHVTLTRRVDETITHGAFSGALDGLSNTSVAEIISVIQGGTTYVKDVDYQLTNDQVDWSLGGNEPSPGSSYDIVYTYLDTTQPDDWDSTSITVSDVEPSSTAIVAYDYALPRIDTFVIDRTGIITYIKGQATSYDPFPPQIPHDTLRLADIVNVWGQKAIVRNVATHSVHYNKIEKFGAQIDDLLELVAQERLRTDMDSRQRTSKRGVFVDPFFDDDMRDNGIGQTGAILEESLQLPIATDVETVSLGDEPLLLPYEEETVIDQPLCTGEMKINPYQAFEPLPALMEITPAIDRFTRIETEWTSPETRQLVFWRFWWQGNPVTPGTTETIELVNTEFTEAQFLREIEVTFSLEGFGPGENLETLTFDGVEVAPVAA